MNAPSSQPGALRRPVIGVTPDITLPTADSPFPKFELKRAYTDAVMRAGGLPMVIPYSEEAAVREAYLDRVNGLVVTGGAFDIPPEQYGEDPRDGMGPTKEGRTLFETELLQGALKRGLPVLGVCGGMQLLAVVCGAKLFQDIVKEMPGAKNHEQTIDRSQPLHPIEVQEGTLLAECIGKGQLWVNSTHHQAVRATVANLRVSALAHDGVIEAVEATDYAFALGVQWHPELMIDTVPAHLGLYKVLVARARDRR